jgi:hypothetical protein
MSGAKRQGPVCGYQYMYAPDVPEDANTMKISNTTDLGLCVCGRRIYSCTSNDEPAVMHALPYCQKFQELDALEFLKYVRRSRGIPDGAVDHVQ